MEVIQTNALISINATFVVQLVTFLIFMAIMNRVMFQPLRTAMAQRKFRMRKLREEIATAGEQLTAIETDLAEQKRAVREEAQAVNQALEAAAGEQVAAMFDKTRAKTADMRRSAEGRIEAQLEVAQGQVADEARRLSTEIMQKVLQRRLS
jgi:F-type H+-transporting ATPase subunit b